MIRYFLVYILAYHLIFASSYVWDKLYSSVLDDKPLEEGLDVLSEAEFPKFFQAAQEQFQTLYLCQAGSWSELVNIIMRQPIKDTTFDWVFPICQILRFGNFKRRVEYDMKNVSLGTDREDQIMKIDIIRNLGHYDAKFSPMMDYFLVPFQSYTPPSQDGLSESIDLKYFALMFGDGFITNELDTTGKSLEGGYRTTTGMILYRLLHKAELKIQELELEETVDLSEIRKLGDAIKKSLAFTQVLKSCMKKSKPFELFEDIMISQLRTQAPGDEFLIAAGFTEHAMLISFTKNAGKYEVSVYNSGSGIGFHESTTDARLKKYSPLMRFTSIPLARLKASGFIRRIVEIDSSDQPISPDGTSKNAYSKYDMYENVISVLKPYETHLGGIGPDLKKLVKTQRSGTCAWRCYMVYMAAKLDNFRLIKLIISKEALTVALNKPEFSTEASPIARRLVKFALENYARSVEKFGKFDDVENSIDLDIFGDDDFWEQYEKYAGVWPYSKKREFRIEPAVLTPAGQVSPHGQLLHYARENEALFDQLSRTGINHPVQIFPDNERYQMALFNDFKTAEEFKLHLDSLLAVVKQSWTGTPDLDKLSFLVSTILFRWPIPSKSKKSIYFKVFNESEKGLVAQEALFRLAKTILGLMYNDLKWFPQIGIALAKILAIYHQLLIGIHKKFAKVRVFDCLEISEEFWSIMVSRSINYQCDELKDILFASNGVECFDFGSKKMETCEKNVLVEYLKDVMVKNSFIPGDSLSGSVMKVFSKKLHAAFPAALYYWRDMAFIVVGLKTELNIGAKTVSSVIPFIDSIDQHNPLSSCDFETIEPETVCFGRSYRTTLNNWTDEISEDYDVDLSVKLEGFQAHEFQYRRYYKPAGHTDLKTNITDNFFHTSRTKHCKQYLGLDFMGILDECKADIKLNEMMELSKQIAHSELSFEMIESVVKLMIKNLDLDLGMLETKSSFRDSRNVSERIAGMIIAACYISARNHDACSTELAELRQRISMVAMKEGRDESLVFLQLAFLASAQPSLDGYFSRQESSKMILMNQKFVNISRLLPEHFRFQSLKFTVCLNVAQAVTAYYNTCEGKKQYQEVSSLPLQADQAAYPWVLTTLGKYLDLVSGIHHSPSGVVSKSLDENSRKLLEEVKLLHLEKQIEESYKSFKSGFAMTIFIPKPATKWVFEGMGCPSKLDILKIEVVKSNNILCRILLSHGNFAYHVPKQLNITWKYLPIPATEDSETPYDVWCVPLSNEIWFISESGVVYVRDAFTYLLKEFPYKMIESSRLPHSVPLCSSDMIEVFNCEFGRLVLFKNLLDIGGNRLIFTQRYTETQWVYKNNEQYWISSNQEFKTSSYIKHSLVIESKNNSKVFIPIMHVKVSKTNLNGTDESPMQQKKCLLFALSSESSIEPKSVLEYLLLAYHYLIARNYLLSFEALMRVHQMESFGDEELRLFGWIISSHDDNLDGSPESCAIRAYASFLVYSNRNFFFGAYRAFAGQNTVFPYSKTSEWRSYWSMLLGGYSGILKKTVLQYYTIKSKIPSMLRHDPASRRHLQSKDEQQKWLESLKIDILNKPKRSNIIYPSEQSLTSNEMQSMVNDENELYELASECLKNPKRPLTLNLDKVSWVNPEILESKFSTILVELLFMNIRPYQREQLILFLTSLLETSLIRYAKPLHLALTDDTNREHWRKLVLSRDIEALHEEIDDCAEDCSSENSAPAQFPADRMEMEGDCDIAMSEEYPILTQLYDDNIDITELKASGDVSILTSAIQKLTDFRISLEDSIRRISGSREPTKRKQISKGLFTLSTTDLLRLYSQASFDLYRQLLPDIDNARNYQPLHDLITRWVLVSTDINDLKRILAALSSGNQHEIEKELRRVRITTTQDNIALAYEAYINSRLEKQQIDDTRTLLKIGKEKGSAKLLQRIMSSGKTFVYGTCLAVGRADGHHLSVLVVPKSLFSSEATNIIMRTMGAFGYDGFSFEVSRDGSDAKTLEWIHRSMQKAIKERKYLIIPPETLLILQNMFFEESMAQIGDAPKYTALRKILSLLRSRGVVVFDEVDTLFNPKHELNSPISSSLQSDSSADLLNLHGLFIAEIFICSITHEVGIIQNIRQNIMITEETYKNVIPELARILVKKLRNDEYYMDILNNPRMPRDLFKQWSEDELFEFLTIDPVKFSKYQSLFSTLGGIHLNLLSLCRLAIQDWVYMAWNGSVNENFGVSPDPSIAYAIPYMGANNPRADSEFSFRWYSYTRTMRMYLVLGFNKISFARSFKWILNRYNEEGENLGLKHLVEGLFGLGLHDLENLEDQDIERLGENLKIRTNTVTYYKFMFEWIVADVMPSIKFYQQQISSNAHDIPMMVKSYCAYSGTIPSLQQLPPMLRKYGDFKNDIVDSIRDAVIRNSTVHLVPNGISSKVFSNGILKLTGPWEEKGYPFSAIIDVGAFFKEESNEKVAESVLNEHGKKSAVLFYHQNKLVYSTRTEKNKALGATSKTGLIEQGLQEDGRVTYYDQQHTTGSDVYHHPRGVAAVIIGLKTTSRDFYQAVMRMRALLQEQRLIIMAPNDTFMAIMKFTGSEIVTVHDCLRFMDYNQESEAKKSNLMALFKIIRAQYKDVLYQELLQKPGTTFSDVGLWIKETEMNLEMMAMPRTEKNTFEIVKGYHEHLKKISQKYLDAASFEKVVRKTNKIINNAEAETIMYEPVIASIEGQISGSQAEQMTEHQAEAAKLVELEVESTTANAAPGDPVASPFTIDFEAKEFPEIPDYNIHSQSLKAGFINLEKFFAVNPAFNLLSGMFDERIYVSKGFTDVFFGSKRSLVLNVLVLYKNLEEPANAPVDEDHVEDNHMAVEDNRMIIEEDVEMPPDAAPKYDIRFVILSSFEAEKFCDLADGDEREHGFDVFGYKGFLRSPTEALSSALQEKLPFEFTVLGDYESLMCEILVFGGHYNVLSQPMWKHHFADWLGHRQRKALRSAVFREVILDREEWKKAVKGGLSIVDSCTGSPFEHAQISKSTPFVMLKFLSRDTSAILELYERLSDDDPTKIILVDTEAFYNLDEDGTILASALPQTLSLSSDLELIRRLGVGLRVNPKKLIDIFMAYIRRADLSSMESLLKIAQISESLALLTGPKDLSGKIDDALKKIAEEKVFSQNCLAVRALFPLITPNHGYNLAFMNLFRTMKPMERTIIEDLYAKARPTWAVLEAFHGDLVKAMYMEKPSDFPDQERLIKTLKSFKGSPMFSIRQFVYHLLVWCKSVEKINMLFVYLAIEYREKNILKLNRMDFDKAKQLVLEKYATSVIPQTHQPLIEAIPEPQSKKQKTSHVVLTN